MTTIGGRPKNENDLPFGRPRRTQVWGRERALVDSYDEDGAGAAHGDEYDRWRRPWQRLYVPRVGVYPGSFNPPTVAHVEIALAALAAHGLARVDLAVSIDPLGKDEVAVPSFAHRVEVLEAVAADHDGLGVLVTQHRLIVDVATGYDVVVMGADKWAQVNDPAWYPDVAARDHALARLPSLALAPRPPHDVPDDHRLAVADDLLEVSSTAVRAGRHEWMAPAARRFDATTGAWTDPDRYRRTRA